MGMNHQKPVFAVKALKNQVVKLDLEHLFSFYPSAGACSELFHLYVAETNLPEQGGIFGVANEGENIQLHLFDYAEIKHYSTMDV
jgi:ADP-ribose pyrophosphatase